MLCRVVSLRPNWLEKVLRPPDVIYNSCNDVVEALCMPEHFDNCGCSETVTCHDHFVHMKSVLPLCPIHTLQASGGTTNKAFGTEVLSGNLFAFPRTNELQHSVRFFELTESQFNLSIPKVGINSKFIVW